MKRLQAFVDSLGRDDLLVMKRLVEERYLEKATEVMEDFMVTGKEVFINVILRNITQIESLSFLLELKTVSKVWNLYMRDITHVNLRNSSFIMPVSHIIHHFPLVRSIEGGTWLYHLRDPLIERIEILKIHKHFITFQTISQWVSLKTLILLNNVQVVHGLGKLTNLTDLTCHADSFSHENDIFNLTNLTNLKMEGFRHQSGLAEKLPKLCHLESDNPAIFGKFTGTGLLKNGDSSRYEPPIRIGNIRNVVQLDLNGRWDNGLFTGSCFVKFEKGEGEWKSLVGNMITGKLSGLVTMLSHYRDIVYVGSYLDGVKHGEWQRYKVDEVNKTCDLERSEQWKPWFPY